MDHQSQRILTHGSLMQQHQSWTHNGAPSRRIQGRVVLSQWIRGRAKQQSGISGRVALQLSTPTPGRSAPSRWIPGRAELQSWIPGRVVRWQWTAVQPHQVQAWPAAAHPRRSSHQAPPGTKRLSPAAGRRWWLTGRSRRYLAVPAVDRQVRGTSTHRGTRCRRTWGWAAFCPRTPCRGAPCPRHAQVCRAA